MEQAVRTVRGRSLGVDVGGTFTDFVYFHDGEEGPEDERARKRVTVYKLPSTPDDPSRAFLQGIEDLDVDADADVVHGSTVATNALLERKGARTALITIAGFKDVLEIGRQNRPRLYALYQEKPPRLVPARWRFEVDERVENKGEVLTALDPTEVDALVEQLLIRDRAFAYYETVASGTGAAPQGDGLSGVHSHMNNTLNTPIEALELSFPFRLRAYAIRRGSGGEGRDRGGDGLRREFEFLAPAAVTVLSERRRFRPYGLEVGGEPGPAGRNVLVREGKEEELAGKVTVQVRAGDVLKLHTPGAGAWGETERGG